MTRISGWDDDVPYIGGEGKEFLEQLVSETDLPPPEHWDSYDLFINERDGSVAAIITDDQGIEHEVSVSDVDVATLDEWDWVFDVWDWILDNYPDVDRESHYAES